MYKKAIVDELGNVMFWCSDLCNDEIDKILNEYPDCRVTCVEV